MQDWNDKNTAGESKYPNAENAKSEVLLRARHNHFISTLLDMQKREGWTEEAALSLMVCYLSDALDSVSSEMLMLRTMQPMRIISGMGAESVLGLNEILSKK